jgi:hypothetical protein
VSTVPPKAGRIAGSVATLGVAPLVAGIGPRA